MHYLVMIFNGTLTRIAIAAAVLLLLYKQQTFSCLFFPSILNTRTRIGFSLPIEIYLLG